MPPRHAYWTIIVDNQPTAFRAHEPEELLATLNRLKEKHPSAVMKWFERGQLFDSREHAREQGLGQGERRWEGPRPSAEGDKPRDRNWRPGGEHRDPRQKYKDAKKAKWQRVKQNARSAWENKRGARPDPETFSPPHGDPLRNQIDRDDRPARAREGRAGQPSRPHGDPMHPSAHKPRAGDPAPHPSAHKPRAEEPGPIDPGTMRSKGRGGWKPKGPPRGDWPRRDEGRDRWQDRQDAGGPRDENRGRGEWKPKGPPTGGRGERERSGPMRSKAPGGWKPKGPPRGDWPRRDEGRDRWQGRQGAGGSRDENRGRGEWKPKGPPTGGRDDRDRSGDWRDRPREHRGDYQAKPSGPPRGKKPFRPKPAGAPGGAKRFGDRKPWGAKPAGGKAFGPRGPRRPPSGGNRPGPPRGRKKPRGDEE